MFEAMECLGGNGYVEESILPRLYREAPVNAIWEGSGNVMCLDVLRALKREEEAELVAALSREAGADVPGDQAMDLASASEATARTLVGRLALLATAAALRASAPPTVAEAFMRTRVLQPHAGLYGADGMDAATAEMLLQRALPES